MQVRQAYFFREPLGEGFEVQQLLGLPRVFPLLVGNHDQGMDFATAEAAVAEQLVRGFLGDQLVGNKVSQQLL